MIKYFLVKEENFVSILALEPCKQHSWDYREIDHIASGWTKKHLQKYGKQIIHKSYVKFKILKGEIWRYY